MKNKSSFLVLVMINIASLAFAQPDRWQQHIDYTIKASLDVTNNIVKGKEDLVYTNNSPDTLRKVYFHLYRSEEHTSEL